MTSDALEIAHHHPGRLRLRSKAFLADQDAAETARRALAEIPGVLAVTRDERTGSLLISYQPALVEAGALVGAVAAASRLPVRVGRRNPPLEREPGALRLIELTKELDALTLQVTRGRMGLGSLIPAAMVGLSAFAFVKSPAHRLPRWDNLLYWSFSIFSSLHQSEIAAQRPAER